MGRRATSCSSSTIDSSSCRHHQSILVSSAESYPSHHSPDLSLALGISASPLLDFNNPSSSSRGEQQSVWQSSSRNTLFVKVYMAGIPIGRKLDLLAHDGYDALVATLDQMFRTNVLWAEEGGESKRCHVLIYEDKEGDWLMVGDVPWEMFLTNARRLRITRIDR